MDPEETATAYHEAGHLIVNYLLGWEVVEATIVPGQYGDARVRIADRFVRKQHEDQREWLRTGDSRNVDTWLPLVCLSGHAALTLFEGGLDVSGTMDDAEACFFYRHWLECHEAEPVRLLVRCAQEILRVACLLHIYWPAVEYFAEALCNHRTLRFGGGEPWQAELSRIVKATAPVTDPAVQRALRPIPPLDVPPCPGET